MFPPRSDEVRAQLAPHLPEGSEPTAQALADLLRSPQFAQTTQNLTQVCQHAARKPNTFLPHTDLHLRR